MSKLITTVLVVFFMAVVLSIQPSPPPKTACTGQCLLDAKQDAAGMEVKRMRDFMDSKGYNPMDAVVLEPNNE
jgi:hypothetical protein